MPPTTLLQLVLAAAVLLAAGVMLWVTLRERKPNVRSPRRFQGGGLAFLYPRNWRLAQQGGDDARTITIGSRGGTSAVVLVETPRESHVAFADWVADYVGAFAADVEQRMAARTGGLGPEDRGWERVETKVGEENVSGIGRELTLRHADEPAPCRCYFFEVVGERRRVLVVLQAEPASWNRVTPGFALVLRSLRVA